MNNCSWSLQTPCKTGAIAIVQLEGDIENALPAITGINTWQLGIMKLVNIQGVDEAIAVKLQENTAQIMLHGGMQVIREFSDLCEKLELKKIDKANYIEATDTIEAAMLETISIATSEDAIDLLLAQPPKLRGAVRTQEDDVRSKKLDWLIIPPKIVLLGQPNTGKSTLMNALTREETSIVHPLPGATRDAVGARINCAGLVVDIYDLPGFRKSNDPIEQEAISIAKKIKQDANLHILVADNENDWINENYLAIRVSTKSDIQFREDADLCVCAINGNGISELAALIRETLVPREDFENERPWFFTGLETH
jgi:small GTP-binding protein